MKIKIIYLYLLAVFGLLFINGCKDLIAELDKQESQTNTTGNMVMLPDGRLAPLTLLNEADLKKDCSDTSCHSKKY